MKKSIKDISEIEISYLTVFVVTAVIVIIMVLFQKSELLLHSQFLNKSTLSLIQYQESNSKSLFLYVFKERFWVIPLLFLLSTTYLSKATGYGLVLWYATGIGAVAGVAILRYGLVGLIFIACAGIPQYLVYVPAFIVALGLTRRRRIAEKSFFGQLFLLEVVVIIGCILESYVNPQLLEKIIYLFFRS